MATGQGILDRLKQAKASNEGEKINTALPMAAYYGREPEAEAQRTKMYECVGRVMRMPDPEEMPRPGTRGDHGYYLLLEVKDAVALVNAASSPIEFLVASGEMDTDQDEDGMAGSRFHTALRLRDLIDGSQVKGLKSPLLGGVGGGSGSAASIRGYQLDCMSLIGKLRKAMPADWIYPMIADVVFMDEWLDIWPHNSKGGAMTETHRKQRLKTIHAVHYALDRVALTLNYLAEETFMQRWPHGEPAAPPSVRRRNRESRAANQLALLTSQGAR